jgi:hypothetical protein
LTWSGVLRVDETVWHFVSAGPRFFQRRHGLFLAARV